MRERKRRWPEKRRAWPFSGHNPENFGERQNSVIPNRPVAGVARLRRAKNKPEFLRIRLPRVVARGGTANVGRLSRKRRAIVCQSKRPSVCAKAERDHGRGKPSRGDPYFRRRATASRRRLEIASSSSDRSQPANDQVGRRADRAGRRHRD